MKICGEEYKSSVLELNRLWCYDEAPKNSESFLISQVRAWEKFINKWNEDFESGEVDLNPNKIKSFLVERGADEFIK